ncbi:MAG: M15 family metallopeptidase [Flavobacteriales bacterium]|nr:M15 family metallopeptidase [Flavobacteriales bacterium]
MQKAKLGETSIKKLSTCHKDLIKLIRLVEKRVPFDFTVLEGARTIERQKELFDQGKSKIDGVTHLGRHNYTPSHAIDLSPYPIDWGDLRRFMVLGGVVLSCANELGLTVRWGADWDMDGDYRDQNFNDLPHFELRG